MTHLLYTISILLTYALTHFFSLVVNPTQVGSIASTSEYSFLSQLGIHALIYLSIAVGIWLLDITVGRMLCQRYGWCVSVMGKIVCVNIVMYCYLLLGEYQVS